MHEQGGLIYSEVSWGRPRRIFKLMLRPPVLLNPANEDCSPESRSENALLFSHYRAPQGFVVEKKRVSTISMSAVTPVAALINK